MAAMICWESVSKNTKTIGVGAPSNFIRAMEEAGFPLPCEIGQEFVPILRAMGAVYGGADKDNPYQQILGHLEIHDTIRLWAEY